MWNPWRPGGSSDISTAIITPYGASTSTALPTTSPPGLRNSALAASRSTSPGMSQLGIWAPDWGPAGASARATWAAQTSSTPPATSANAWVLVGHSRRACRKPRGLTASEDLAGERHPDSSSPHTFNVTGTPPIIEPSWARKPRRSRRGTSAHYVVNNVYARSRPQDLALEIQPDHVHLFFSAPPAIAPSLEIQWFKGITARSLFAEVPALCRVLRRGHLWAPSCSVGTAGPMSAETIRRYIERAEHVRTRR